MKHAKILGLFPVVATALMALTGSASADLATAPANTLHTAPIHATNKTSLTFHGFVDITCNHSEIIADIETHGAGKTVEGTIEFFGFTNCNHHLTVLKPGRLIAHATSNGHATLTQTDSEITVTVTTIFGATHCLFGTNNTPIGTLTPASTSVSHATLDISANINTLSTDFACGFSPAAWTGAYTVGFPTGLRFDVS